ncbi:MAG: hypothetical protein IPK64_15405 [bacterium]|nr:hypothetical protein [bacterium]
MSILPVALNDDAQHAILDWHTAFPLFLMMASGGGLLPDLRRRNHHGAVTVAPARSPLSRLPAEPVYTNDLSAAR